MSDKKVVHVSQQDITRIIEALQQLDGTLSEEIRELSRSVQAQTRILKLLIKAKNVTPIQDPGPDPGPPGDV